MTYESFRKTLNDNAISLCNKIHLLYLFIASVTAEIIIVIKNVLLSFLEIFTNNINNHLFQTHFYMYIIFTGATFFKWYK